MARGRGPLREHRAARARWARVRSPPANAKDSLAPFDLDDLPWAHSRFPGTVCRQRWTVRLGEVEPVFGQTGRVVLDITARTAHDGALKWTRAPSTPRAARSIFATFPSTCALPSGGRWSLRRVLERPGRQRKRSSAKSSCGPSRTSSSAPSSPPCCNARCAPPRLATRRAPSCLPRRMRSDGLETVNVRTSRGTTVPVTTPYYREKHARRAKRRPGLYPIGANWFSRHGRRILACGCMTRRPARWTRTGMCWCRFSLRTGASWRRTPGR